MKKTIIFLLFILSTYLFGQIEKNYKPYLWRNPMFIPVFENENEEELVFSGEFSIESNEKILSIYKTGNKLVYVYGIEDEKPEIIIVGKPGENLFTNYGIWTLDDYMNKVEIKFIAFKNKNYTYLLSFANAEGKIADEYKLIVYKDKNRTPIFEKTFQNGTLYDSLLKNDFNNIEDIPKDKENFYLIY